MRRLPRTALVVAALTLLAGTVTVAQAAPAAAAPATPTATTKSIVRSAVLATSGQSMWSSGASKPTDATLNLFHETWNETSPFGEVDKECALGICTYYGADFVGSVSGEIGMSVKLQGLGGGTLSVTYPVTVTFTAPADNSFDPGAAVDITSSMVVDAAKAKIVGHFPDLTHIGLNAVLKANASLTGEVCFIGCTPPGNIFPPVAIDNSGELLGLDPSQLNTCFSGKLGYSFFLSTYPNDRCGDDGYFFSPDPKVSTTFNPADGSLSATGKDTYAVLPVNVNPAGGSDFFLGAVSVNWTVFKAIITAIETMEQDLTFTPRVDVNLNWGKSLGYEVRSGLDNSPVRSGTGTSATFKVGDTLRLTTNALNSKVIPVTPTLSMGSATVTNSTRNASETKARLEALAFHVITYDAAGDVDSDDGFGPAYSETFPVGTTRASIFNGSFALEGFNAPTLEPFDLVPRPVVEVRKSVVPANAPGLFNLTVDGTTVAPNVGDAGTSGRLVLDPGTHVLSETAGTGGSLALFDTTTRCVQRDGGAVHTVGGSTTNVLLAGGDDLVCTVKNRLPAAAECDSMVFDNVIVGTPGQDTLRGTSGRDMIIGYGGDDTIDAGGGDDCVAGGAGNDRLDLGQGNDVGDGGSGSDDVGAGQGNDVVHLGSGNDAVGAGPGNDLLYGEDGDDTVDGGDGLDNLLGGSGDDTLTGGSDNDRLDGGLGTDRTNGSNGFDVCVAESKSNCEA